MRVDLPKQTIEDPCGNKHSFEIDAFRKYCMINGLDDYALTMQFESKLDEYEKKAREKRPWLF
jgi:3-isopropylmalate/(R)-2-methylmalate dehydratase small subunit